MKNHDVTREVTQGRILTPGEQFSLDEVTAYVHANGIRPDDARAVAREVLDLYEHSTIPTLREALVEWQTRNGAWATPRRILGKREAQ